ncbi:arylsulfatase [Xylariaceae sp. FL0804]|nr:arylsulfatase [Xylariaceae sp. FL0804]
MALRNLCWLSLLGLFCGALGAATKRTKQPNIVLIFTDDQDLHLGSTEYQGVLQRELAAKGTTFTQHYCTVAKCCPSRASLFRGQAGHNTNITDVSAPGGNYDKWLISGQNDDYLPLWLTAAGYTTEYIGKFMNGYNTANYNITPKGWSHIDTLVDDYTYEYNNVVMSANGETPIHYPGYHQSDVLRAKAVDRIANLTSQDKPFYLTIAPVSPHKELGAQKDPIPPARYADAFPNATVPRGGNYNPSDAYQQQKVVWIRNLTSINATMEARLDQFHRARLRSLLGVDDIIEDVVAALGDALADTFIIYTADNGFHLGNHRVIAGKSLPYREDTNVPFVVRGPGVPANATSARPGAHLDLAPTFLDIAGLAPGDTGYPAYLDGRSLLTDWQHTPSNTTRQPQCAAGGDARELINVEFWGPTEVENPNGLQDYTKGSYKTLRVVAGSGSGAGSSSYLYSRWCTNETELYATHVDAAELTNLALPSTTNDTETRRLLSRLDALLLATKSCAGATCRDPWRVLQPEASRRGVDAGSSDNLTISSLEQALDPRWDSFFTSLPSVAFQECMTYQYRPNEEPYWPAAAAALGDKYRLPTDNYVSSDPQGETVGNNTGRYGTVEQRNVTLATIMETAVQLTPEQLG